MDGPTTTRIARGTLALTSLAFAYFGLMFLMSPGAMLAPLEIPVETALATAEIQAMYGGLELGASVFFMWGALSVPLVKPALLAEVCLVGGLGATRLVATLVNGVQDSGLLWSFVGLELGSAALAAGLLVALGRGPASGERGRRGA